jgi:hypothetical protein
MVRLGARDEEAAGPDAAHEVVLGMLPAQIEQCARIFTVAWVQSPI